MRYICSSSRHAGLCPGHASRWHAALQNAAFLHRPQRSSLTADSALPRTLQHWGLAHVAAESARALQAGRPKQSRGSGALPVSPGSTSAVGGTLCLAGTAASAATLSHILTSRPPWHLPTSWPHSFKVRMRT